MSTRKVRFANGEFYHIYNRGIDKRIVVADSFDVDRFFQSMDEFNSVEPIGSIYENSFRKDSLGRRRSKLRPGRLVNFVCYCINNNHYHFILEQIVENGIKRFMRNIGGGFTKYFNIKHSRNGPLFQGPYKVVHIDSDEYLLHLSAYVNLNRKVHQLGSSTSRLGKSSWGEYIGKERSAFCKKDIILDQFKNISEYKKFALSSLEDILERKELARELKDLLLE